jgi:hypothetical protein
VPDPLSATEEGEVENFFGQLWFAPLPRRPRVNQILGKEMDDGGEREGEQGCDQRRTEGGIRWG